MIVDSINMLKENEKIVIVNESFADDEAKEIYEKSLGVDYLITCPIEDKEYVIKKGNSRNTFKDRLSHITAELLQILDV